MSEEVKSKKLEVGSTAELLAAPRALARLALWTAMNDAAGGRTVSLGHVWPTVGIRAWLLRRFPDADVVVYGHTHAADVRRLGKTLVFNPGAVYQVTPEEARARLENRPGWFEWSWLQVMRRRRRWPTPTVGLLEVRDRGITASILPL